MSTAERIVGDLERVLWAWRVLLIVGTLSVIAGVIVLAKPHISLATLAVVTGIFLLVATLALLVGISFIVRGLVLGVVAWARNRASRGLGAAARDPATAA